MKKILVCICVLGALLLASCGGDDTVSNPEKQESNTVSVPETSVPDNTSVPEDTSPSPETSTPPEASLPEDAGYADALVDASGIFLSDYGCGVDIEVRWTLKSVSEGKVKYTAEVYLLSYSISVGVRYGDCKLVINDATYNFGADAVNLEDVSKREYTYLATVEKELTLSEESHAYDITVSYPFRGTYNGVSLPAIEAATYIVVNTDGSVEIMSAFAND